MKTELRRSRSSSSYADPKDNSRDEVIDEFQTQAVIHCFNVTVRAGSGEQRKTNAFIVTFKGSTLKIPLRNDLYCDEWDVKLYYTIPYFEEHQCH